MMQSQQQKGNPGLNVDRSARSIFVGNISYDVSEEELRKLLSACGQIVNFRLVHDRDTGRPKGFGFCEFVDVQMADTAIRNFNGYEIRGRQLRVDSATGNDRSADEVQQFQMTIARPQQQPPAQQQPAMPEENPYGPEPEAGKAPEAIARTVASMPPEKMFELMRSMKDTVNNNPQMARQLLIENPQLSYALLQAQVVMRVVDPKVAYSMLHREQAQPLVPQQQPPPQMGGMTGPPPSVVPPFQQGPPPQFSVPPPQMTQQPPQSQFSMPPPGVVPGPGGPQFHHNFPPPGMGMPPPRQPQPPPQHFGGQPPQQQHQTPMVQQMAPQQMPQQQSMVSSQSNDSLDEEQQAQMLVRVLQLTDEQIRMLPPTERAQVIELRNQLRNAGATA